MPTGSDKLGLLQWQRWRLELALAFGLPLAGIGAYVGSHVCTSAVPERLWTRADLHDPVAATENGWSLVAVEHTHIELPDALAQLGDATQLQPEAFWRALADERAALATFLARADVRKQVGRVKLAAHLEHFADACEVDARCHIFAWLQAHRLAVLEAAWLTERGEIDQAGGLLRELIELDQSHLASARSLISLMIALSNLEAALDMADKLAAHPEVVGRPSSAALAGLGGTIAAVDVEALPLHTIVVGEYVHFAELLDEFAAGSPWLFDHAETLAEVNGLFERRDRAARAGDVAGALGVGEPRATASFGWWAYNPSGKLLLDQRWDARSLAASITTQRAEIARARADALARLTSSGAPGPR
jgi:hypothetical protein